MPATATRLHPALPGLGAAAAAALIAWAVHALVPAIPLLTVAVALGIVAAQIPAARPALTGPLKPGLTLASKRLMRIGVVLLGLQLGLSDIVGLGWRAVLLVVAVVVLAFAGTYAIARALRMPGQQPLLLATGFSICGASAIGAMAGVTRAKPADQGAPVALVTLCGTLAIAVLPPLAGPLGLDDVAFGHWVGAGVHDVGQVVATAQIAGSAALTIAIAVKLTRVLLLAPVVAVAGVVMRRREGRVEGAARPPIVPLFVLGFLAAVLVRTFVPLPVGVLDAAQVVQTALLAIALVALGSAVRLRELVGQGGSALAAGLLSCALIAGLALAAVRLS